MKKKIKIIKLESLDVKPKYKIFVEIINEERASFTLVRIIGDVWEEILEASNTNIDVILTKVHLLSQSFKAEVFEKQSD